MENTLVNFILVNAVIVVGGGAVATLGALCGIDGDRLPMWRSEQAAVPTWLWFNVIGNCVVGFAGSLLALAAFGIMVVRRDVRVHLSR